jgi:hypothetical protein
VAVEILVFTWNRHKNVVRVAHFVDIGAIVDHHCFIFLSRMIKKCPYNRGIILL